MWSPNAVLVAAAWLAGVVLVAVSIATGVRGYGLAGFVLLLAANARYNAGLAAGMTRRERAAFEFGREAAGVRNLR